MLTSLRIENIVLIERLDLEFESGLCTLTGETGAGKSILLDSLGLALGMRAEASLVRHGTERAHVYARFSLLATHPVWGLLREAEIEVDPLEELLIRRSLTADGRSRAYINDQPISVGLLKAVGGMLVEIHGQFDTQILRDPSSHLMLLDDYAGVAESLRPAWNALSAARSEVERLSAQAEAARADELYLRQSVEDLEGLDPQEDEEGYLDGARSRLMHKEQVMEALSYAEAALSGDSDPVGAAWGAIERVGDKLGEQGQALIETLARASHELQEARAQLTDLLERTDDEGLNLEEIDERLYALRAQARKHSCAVSDLPQVLENLRERLDMIAFGDDAIEAARVAMTKARDAYVDQAQALREKRQAVAVQLDKAIGQELVPLKMERARFVTRFTPLPETQWGAHGMDQVQFLVATNPGAEPGALNKIASGGEMSRFMLALKAVMAQVGAAPTMIFDEVDAGVGGAVADAVGARLHALSKVKQVMVVTHAPQVAARAAHHYVVSKTAEEPVRSSVVRLSSREERAEEVARMLSGASVSDEARRAAEKLLVDAA